jgi:hypothetical protein
MARRSLGHCNWWRKGALSVFISIGSGWDDVKLRERLSLLCPSLEKFPFGLGTWGNGLGGSRTRICGLDWQSAVFLSHYEP